MRAMVLSQPGLPLQACTRADPRPADHQVLIRVHACGVCRTDLHIVDGELTGGTRPVVPGHEIVGTIVERGKSADRWPVGTRVGVPWLAAACGQCPFCRSGQENLCEQARYTGYDIDGGYADMVLADPEFCVPIPDNYSDANAAPLLCAGIIGYRALGMCGDPRRLGIYGLGAAGHIVTQVAKFQDRDVFAFTRPQDHAAQALARDCGADWAGDSTNPCPEPLDAAIIFAPVGELVPLALRAVRKGGVVVCAGIHMSDVPRFPYRLLWGERILRSVANLTRNDGAEFMKLAAQVSIRTTVHEHPLEQANEALAALRSGAVTGAAVLRPQ